MFHEYEYEDDRYYLPVIGLRIGNIDKANININVYNGIPIYSNGGAGNFCLCVTSRNKNRYWMGFNTGPYEKLGLMFHLDQKLKEELRLQVFARFGGSEGITESAIGLGLKYQLVIH